MIKNSSTQVKSTGDPIEESIIEEPEEEPMTEDSKSTLSLGKLKSLSLRTLRSFRILNDFFSWWYMIERIMGINFHMKIVVLEGLFFMPQSPKK